MSFGRSFLDVLVAVVLAALSPLALGAERNWTGGDGFWDVPANWGGSKPTSLDEAYVDTGATVTVRTAGEQASRLELGYYNTAAGSLTITPSGGLTLGYLVLAASSDSSSHLDLQPGGVLSTGGAQIGSYGSATAMLAGTLNSSGSLIVGLKGSGNITQTSGTVSVSSDVSLAPITSSSQGIYRLYGGTLAVARGNSVNLGGEGTGTLLLGNAAGTGTLMQTGSGSGVNLNIGQFTDYGGGFTTLGTGELRGHGNAALTGQLDLQHGKVIADGYGTDRLLTLTGFTTVVNGYENEPGHHSGWYATGKGKLSLPAIAVAAGDHAYNWGESAGDSSIDLVNSFRMAITGAGASGSLTASLLAPDHSEIAAGLPGTAIGVWDVGLSGTGFSSAVLTFRYDDLLADDPSTLRIYHHTGGVWIDVTAAVSPGTFTISTTPISSLSQFAVVVPEPGSLLGGLMGIGGLIVCRLGRGTNDSQRR